MSKLLWLALLAGVLSTIQLAAQGQTTNKRRVKAIKSVKSSTVKIIVFLNDSLIEEGTGFFVSNRGYVLTNDHVVRPYYKKNGNRLSVLISRDDSLGKFREYEGELVGGNFDTDLALIKLKNNPFEEKSKKPFRLSVVKFTKREVMDGDEIATTGFPSNSEYPITTNGFIATAKMLDDNYWGDINTYTGNSGGPVYLTSTGEVIAVSRKTAWDYVFSKRSKDEKDYPRWYGNPMSVYIRRSYLVGFSHIEKLLADYGIKPNL